MAETTPGPLIQVVQFVGFMGAYRHGVALDPFAAGVVGSIITTWVTFAPCFLWMFVGALYIEYLRGREALKAALSGVTAAVVGVVLNLALWFGIHTLFRETRTIDGIFDLLAPVWPTLDVGALAISAAAFLLPYIWKRGIFVTLATCALFGCGLYTHARAVSLPVSEASKGPRALAGVWDISNARSYDGHATAHRAKEKNMRREAPSIAILSLLALVSVGCDEGSEETGEASLDPTLSSQAASDLDIAALRSATGVDGEEDDGEWKWTVPQNDLEVSVDGFRIVPPMGLGSWAAFTPAPEGAAVMGDLVLLEEEVGPVQQSLIAAGLTATALHKHFLREEPRVAFMHFTGRGTESELGSAMRAVFDRVEELRGGDPGAVAASEVENTLDTGRIEELLGHQGSLTGGVFRVVIGRPDVNVRDRGATVSTFAGFNTWAAFQGTPERAAVAGDFAMLADEVEGVLEALAAHDIEVVVIHNHMTHEEPRIVFLHYWGVGPEEQLALGLRAALDRTGTPPAPNP